MNFPKMSQFQHDWCQSMLDEIGKKRISSFFDKTTSNYAQTHTKEFDSNTSEPMDLSTVRDNLQKEQYDTVEKWGHDMRLIFYNSLSFFEPDDPLYMMAEELQKWFEKRYINFPRTSHEEWQMTLHKTQKLVKKLIKNAPQSFTQESESHESSSNEK